MRCYHHQRSLGLPLNSLECAKNSKPSFQQCLTSGVMSVSLASLWVLQRVVYRKPFSRCRREESGICSNEH
jgi:hypothetical protein